MTHKDMNEENEEIKKKSYELYEKHGFQYGNEYIDWFEAERQRGKQLSLYRSKQIINTLFAIVGILCITVALLLIVLFKKNPTKELSKKSPSEMKVMVLVLDPKDMQIVKKKPKTNVRMAGYAFAEGSEDINQIVSERKADAVRDYLIEKGVAPERIIVISYGRTKPAVYEVTPNSFNSKEAKANMRVLF